MILKYPGSNKTYKTSDTDHGYGSFKMTDTDSKRIIEWSPNSGYKIVLDKRQFVLNNSSLTERFEYLTNGIVPACTIIE